METLAISSVLGPAAPSGTVGPTYDMESPWTNLVVELLEKWAGDTC